MIILIIDSNGKVQNVWLKKNRHALSDKSAMRAVKKAEPLPIPKELSHIEAESVFSRIERC